MINIPSVTRNFSKRSCKELDKLPKRNTTSIENWYTSCTIQQQQLTTNPLTVTSACCLMMPKPYVCI